jgi:hypothetical protein
MWTGQPSGRIGVSTFDGVGLCLRTVAADQEHHVADATRTAGITLPLSLDATATLGCWSRGSMVCHHFEPNWLRNVLMRLTAWYFAPRPPASSSGAS